MAPSTPAAAARVRRQGDVGDLRDRAQRRAGVEALPADPKDQDTQHRQRHVVAGDGLRVALVVVLAEPGAEDKRTCERRHGAGEVNHRRTGEVLLAEAAQPAAAPDPVRHHRVDETHEDDREDQVNAKFGSLQHRAPHDSQRDQRKGRLEEEQQRNGDAVVLEARQEETAAPQERVSLAKSQSETDRPEDERPDAHVRQNLGNDAPDVLHSGEPDLQHGEPGLHEQHQDKRHHHPDGIGYELQILVVRCILGERHRG